VSQNFLSSNIETMKASGQIQNEGNKTSKQPSSKTAEQSVKEKKPVAARPPQVEVHFTPASVDEELLTGKNVVVIDVLRSASSITVALTNGARDVIPVGQGKRL